MATSSSSEFTNPTVQRGQQTLIRLLLGLLRLDLPLFLLLILLSATGLLILASATGMEQAALLRQGVRIAFAFTVMIIVAQIPPRFWRFIAPWAFAGGIVLLLLVLFVGTTGKGAQRWLDLGVIRFQPSEIMKVAVPMMVAWYLADRPLPPRLIDIVIASLPIGITMALIMKQPDLGTSLLIGAAGFFVLFMAGLSWRVLGAVALALMLAAPAAWHGLLHDYQRQRILTFMDPESDPLGSGYHILQSKIAIGSGGLYGKGWGEGTQSRLEFLPERHTDFIFSVFAEELGFLGATLLLILIVAIVFRCINLANQIPDTFGRLLGGSLALTFFVYAFVNIGMVSGLLPVVGVPLPMMSYGGTSMVTLMGGFGILMGLYANRRLLSQ